MNLLGLHLKKTLELECKTHTLKEHKIRKETSVLAFEDEIPESWATPLLAERRFSTRQTAFRHRRTERICWSIMYLPLVLAELRTSSSCFVQEKRILEIMWYWKWPKRWSFTCQYFTIELNHARTQLWELRFHHLYFEISILALAWLSWITILPNTSQAHTGRLEITVRQETTWRHLVLEGKRDFIAQICYEISWYADLPSSTGERLHLICCYMHMQFQSLVCFIIWTGWTILKLIIFSTSDTNLLVFDVDFADYS